MHQNVNKIAKHVLNIRGALPANWVLWSIVDALACQGHTGDKTAHAKCVTTVATLVHLLVKTPAQVVTQQRIIDS